MPRRVRRNLVDAILWLPWWANVAAAVAVYVILAVLLPHAIPRESSVSAVAAHARDYAWLVALLLLAPVPFAVYRRRRRSQLLDANADLASIRNLHWQDFENLVAEAFSRIGYAVAEANGSVAEGGVDLVATAAGEKMLIQCKHWRDARVGVSSVGDLHATMAAEQATAGAVVTSGTFTSDALEFSEGKSIELIDGEKLEKLVANVRRETSPARPSKEEKT